MRWFALCAAGLTCALLAAAEPAAPQGNETIVYRGARIYPVAGKPIDNGVLVVRGGKIVDVGPETTAVPEKAQVVELTGKTIIPGLVDTHSHIGIWPRPSVPAHQDANEGSGAVQSALRALDAIQPDDPGIRMAVSGGITTANIMPGSGNVIGGQTLYVKLRGKTVEEMRIPNTKVLGGLKMANGENPKRANFETRKQAPGTRMKIAAMQREEFARARAYQQKWAAYRKAQQEGKTATPPDVDLAMQPLVEVLERKRTVHFHTHRADDLLTVLRIAEEFDFEVVIQHGTEGYRIVDELVKRKVPVSLTLVDSPGGKPEVSGLLEENGAILDKAGVKVAINTDDSITESRFFLRTGAIALRGGMSEEAALRALTLHGAQILHLDDRLGTLEKGKDADFVVLSGAPFSVYTQVLQTYIDGVRVFDRAQRGDWAYQAGGFALGRTERLPATAEVLKAPEAGKTPEAPKDAPPMKESTKRFAVYAGKVHTVAKGTINDGVVLVEDGRIRYVGPRAGFTLPADTPVLTAAAVTPGLIDAHTVVGLAGQLAVPADSDHDEMSDPNEADLRVLDGFNPNEPLLEFLRMQGVTAVQAMPGRANVIAGQTGVFRTYGHSPEQMTLRFPAGLLVNLGEAPKTSYPNKQPTTRMGTAALVRNAFAQAQTYARKRATTTDPDKQPPRSFKMEALGLALEGKVPVVFSAHRADDLNTALRLTKEFNLHGVLDLATEGYLIADTIAEAKVPVVVHPTMQRVGSLETYNSQLGNARVLREKGIPVAIGTGYEAYVPKTRVVRHEAAIAMVNGLGFEGALRAITLEPARILGIEDRLGTLETGKVADLVLYDGDPFEHATHVTQTILDGRVIYDRVEYLKLPFARRALPLLGGAEPGCCLGNW